MEKTIEANLINFLEKKIDRMQIYHNHKENMVNGGFIVQLTLFSTFIMENFKPPQWISNCHNGSIILTLIGYSIFWCIIQSFIIWQLQNKKIASIFNNGYEAALSKLLFNQKNELDLEINYEKKVPPKKSIIVSFFEKIFPLKKITIKSDIDTYGLPKFISNEINNSFYSGTAANWHGNVLLYSSVFMYLLIFVKMIITII